MDQQIKKYKVCTHCWTYNQAEYIEETLHGFAMQQVSFPVVYIIVDDASTDGEQKYIRQWSKLNLKLDESGIAYTEERQYGEVIYARHKDSDNLYFAILLLSENLHHRGDLKLKYIEEWTGHSVYSAICEGDDYWIDPQKLQKQVDFLDTHLDYGMVCSASKIYEQGIGMKNGVFGHEYRGLEDLLTGNYIFAASVVKRRSFEDRYKQEIGFHSDWKMGDWPRLLYCAITSKIGYIDEPMSVYRVLPNSASHFESFEKFKAFNENSVAVSKWFINKYNLDASKLFPLLDNWLNKRLLLKACALGDVDLVNEFKHSVDGLSSKEKITVFLSSHHVTRTLYRFYITIRKGINYFIH